jgi:hypothetical protein
MVRERRAPETRYRAANLRAPSSAGRYDGGAMRRVAVMPNDRSQYPLDGRRPVHAIGGQRGQERPNAEWIGYTGNYPGFALTTGDLSLFMPDASMQRGQPSPRNRLVWSMDGETARVAIPLTALRLFPRPEYRGPK